MTRLRKLLMYTLLFVASSVTAHAVVSKYIYKIYRFSDIELGVVCMNGATPTPSKFGQFGVIVSCGRSGNAISNR